MLTLTAAELEEAAERCYYALWGYDGQGGIGAKVSYERHCREQATERLAATPKRISHRASKGMTSDERHHQKGNGWKANHER